MEIFFFNTEKSEGQEVSLDRMNLDRPGLDPLLDDELLMNVVGMDLKEIFPSEFHNFIGRFPTSGVVR